jgi:hypothetical protein
MKVEHGEEAIYIKDTGANNRSRQMPAPGHKGT